jgi:hypothetical protein
MEVRTLAVSLARAHSLAVGRCVAQSIFPAHASNAAVKLWPLLWPVSSVGSAVHFFFFCAGRSVGSSGSGVVSSLIRHPAPAGPRCVTRSRQAPMLLRRSSRSCHLSLCPILCHQFVLAGLEPFQVAGLVRPLSFAATSPSTSQVLCALIALTIWFVCAYTPFASPLARFMFFASSGSGGVFGRPHRKRKAMVLSLFKVEPTDRCEALLTDR